MSEMNDVVESIWSNWRTKQGACEDCPHWGAGGKAPFYGVDSISDDTEVLFVGKEPGTGSEPVDTKEVFEYISENYPDKFKDYREKRIEDTGMYEEYSNNLTSLVALLRTRGISFNFTNVKKCRETDDGKTDEAIKKCSDYLYEEINALNPSVIVTFGGEATKQVYDRFPSVYDKYDDIPSGVREASSPSGVEDITKDALRPRHHDGLTLISSVHFSYLGPNLQHVPIIPPKILPKNKELEQNERVAIYWTTLIEKIEQSI